MDIFGPSNIAGLQLPSSLTISYAGQGSIELQSKNIWMAITCLALF